MIRCVAAILTLSTVQAQNLGVVELELQTHPSQPLAYDRTALEVAAGQPVRLTFTNNDTHLNQPHNFVLLKPGKTDLVGAQVTSMITDPKAVEKGYIPDSSEDILAHTRLVRPGASETIEFLAPLAPGDYPFFCTFPGHWLQMRGVLHVR